MLFSSLCWPVRYNFLHYSYPGIREPEMRSSRIPTIIRLSPSFFVNQMHVFANKILPDMEEVKALSMPQPLVERADTPSRPPTPHTGTGRTVWRHRQQVDRLPPGATLDRHGRWARPFAGFYVEVGSHDGETHSNTWLFEHWYGNSPCALVALA